MSKIVVWPKKNKLHAYYIGIGIDFSFVFSIAFAEKTNEKETPIPIEYAWILFFFGLTTILVNAYFYIKLL